MNLELRHLRWLVAVADAQTFTDAAIALGTSQASVSRSVAALEQALGVRVFQQRSSGCSPTRRLQGWPTELLMSPSSAGSSTIPASPRH